MCCLMTLHVKKCCFLFLPGWPEIFKKFSYNKYYFVIVYILYELSIKINKTDYRGTTIIRKMMLLYFFRIYDPLVGKLFLLTHILP